MTAEINELLKMWRELRDFSLDSKEFEADRRHASTQAGAIKIAIDRLQALPPSTTPSGQREDVTEAMVEAACKKYIPRWDMPDFAFEGWKNEERRKMRAAITAALAVREK